MPPFQNQTEAAQIRLGVFIVLVSGPSTYQAQYNTICNDNFLTAQNLEAKMSN